MQPGHMCGSQRKAAGNFSSTLHLSPSRQSHTDWTLELGWLPQATCLSPPPQQEYYRHLTPRLMQQARLPLAKVADT